MGWVVEASSCLLLAAVDLPVEIAEIVRSTGRAEHKTVRALRLGNGTILATDVTVALVRILPGVQSN